MNNRRNLLLLLIITLFTGLQVHGSPFEDMDESDSSCRVNSVRIEFSGARGVWDHITVDPNPGELKWLVEGCEYLLATAKEYDKFRLEIKQRKKVLILIFERYRNMIEITQKALKTREMQLGIKLSISRFREITKRLRVLLRAINWANR